MAGESGGFALLLLTTRKWRPKTDLVGSKQRTLFLVVALAASVMSAFGRADMKVQSTKPVPSPDRSRLIIVDHVMPIAEGQPEQYSGRMMVRITDPEGTVTQQRYIETSQVRIIQPPIWMDTQLSAFTYNISKNSNGIIYMDALTGVVVQVEWVSTARRMAGSKRIETELTDFQVAVYGDSVVRLHNLTHGNRPIFPLYLEKLPKFDNAPFPKEFLGQVQVAFGAYVDFCRTRSAPGVRPEQGSESFDVADTNMACLACVGGRPAALIVPLSAKTAQDALKSTALSFLENDVQLSCMADASEPSNSATTGGTSEPTDQASEFRFTTRWKIADVLIEKETYESEDEEPRKTPMYAMTTEGTVTKLDVPPEPIATRTPAPTPVKPPKAEKATGAKDKQTTAPAAAKKPKIKPAPAGDMTETTKTGATEKPAKTPAAGRRQKSAKTQEREEPVETQGREETARLQEQAEPEKTPAVKKLEKPLKSPAAEPLERPGKPAGIGETPAAEKPQKTGKPQAAESQNKSESAKTPKPSSRAKKPQSLYDLTPTPSATPTPASTQGTKLNILKRILPGRKDPEPAQPTPAAQTPVGHRSGSGL